MLLQVSLVLCVTSAVARHHVLPPYTWRGVLEETPIVVQQQLPFSTQLRTQYHSASSARTSPHNILFLRGGAVGPATASLGLKASLTGALFALNVACWLGPLNMRSFTENSDALAVANSFSGGVFLALSFGHLIPHAAHAFSEVSVGHHEALPFAAVLAGYMLIFFIENIAFDSSSMLHAEEGGHSDGKEIGAIVLLVALGAHSLIETMALGVQSSSRSAWLIAGSIGLHQPAESMALLVALLKAGLTRRRITVLLGLFSLLGPIGIALGVAAKALVGGIFEPIMVAITAGTFVYVGATEVIPEEFSDGDKKWIKFSALLLGMAIITAVVLATESLEAQAGM